jgi:hypothetical protein
MSVNLMSFASSAENRSQCRPFLLCDRLFILPCLICLSLSTHCPFYRVSNVFHLVQTVHFTVSQMSFPWHRLSILPCLYFLFLSMGCPSYRVSVLFSLVQTVHLIVSQFSLRGTCCTFILSQNTETFGTLLHIQSLHLQRTLTRVCPLHFNLPYFIGQLRSVLNSWPVWLLLP